MTVQASAETPARTSSPEKRDEIREEIRLCGSNISAETLLATDYLNHFNEIIMMIELAADMPDAFDLTDAWEPLGYQEHFRRSSLSDGELAIMAYEHCPDDIRTEFDETVSILEDHLLVGLGDVAQMIATTEQGAFALACHDLAREARGYIDQLSAIIHGRQHQVSAIEEADTESLEEAQNTIDSLFGS